LFGRTTGDSAGSGFGFPLVNQGLIDIEEDHHCCARFEVDSTEPLNAALLSC
jgi:hypothetical protein